MIYDSRSFITKMWSTRLVATGIRMKFIDRPLFSRGLSDYSTPIRPPSHSTKTFKSDVYPSSSRSKDTVKSAVGYEMDGHTWQFDTERLAKVLTPKRPRAPFNPDQIDVLSAYFDNTIPNEVRKDAERHFKNVAFPKSNKENDHYAPLCRLLNNCVEACDKALGGSKGGYFSGLNFIVWDKPTQDGSSGRHPLKPDLVGGINLPERDEIMANASGGLYWRWRGATGYEILLPVEVKAGWRDLVRQAGTYARFLFNCSPLRKFAVVIGYEHVLQEIRILVFHHGGLTSSKALKIDTSDGIEDLLHIFLAILSWKTVVDAGFPLWCNDSSMVLPSSKGLQALQITKVLYKRVALRGRCSWVVLVSNLDENFMNEKGSTTSSKKHTGRLTIPQENDCPVKDVKQNINGTSSNLNFTSPVVVKCSWVSPAESVESDLLRDCSDLFGTPKYYYSFLASHGDDSPATNHLFLPDDTEVESCHWSLFKPVTRPDRCGLWVHISSFAGHSLVMARSSKMLIHAVLHACLGWFNLMQKGYLHCDISIGNLLMVEDAVSSKDFGVLKKWDWNPTEKTIEVLQELKIDSSTTETWESRLTAALQDLKITNECHGFVIDGDMAIKMADYFGKDHPDSRSGTYPFMSDNLLIASEHGRSYLQSPIDDFFLFYYTMQWAAVFHNREFAAEVDVPFKLKLLREYLLGNMAERSFATSQITAYSLLKPDEYGSVLADCQPVLRAWLLELQNFREDWDNCWDKLERQETKPDSEIYIHLFSTFAVRGTAALAEIVHKYTKDMVN